MSSGGRQQPNLSKHEFISAATTTPNRQIKAFSLVMICTARRRPPQCLGELIGFNIQAESLA